MTYKTITVSFRNPENADRLCTYACMIAKKFGAHLIGVHTIPALEFAKGLKAPTKLAEASGAFSKHKEAGQKAQQVFEAMTAKEGIASEWREVDVQHMKHEYQQITNWVASDLVIIGQSNPERNKRSQKSNVEEAIRSSGRPVLVLPYAGTFETPGETVLVGWSGTREAARSVHDALPFIKEAKSTDIFWVGEQNESSHFMENTANELAVTLDRQGANITVTHKEPGTISIGDELLNAASDSGADLIVTGGFGHSKLYDLVKGATTSYILGCMTVPTLFSH
jgi:nucleotide-binding universal stress UspA family protein